MDKKLYIDENTLRNIRSIKTEREKRGLKQRELAKIIGVSQMIISHYENGLCFPRLEIFFRLADFFNWDITNNINYEFFYKRSDIKKLKKKYYLSLGEISDLTGLRRDLLDKSIYFNRMSINTYAKIMYLINEEKRLAEYRKKYKQ